MGVVEMIEKRPFWMAHPSLQLVQVALNLNKSLDVSPRTWTELAAVLGISKQAISHWRYVPAEGGYTIAVEEIFGIPRHKLRPDVYPDPTKPTSFRVTKTGTAKLGKERKRG